jgi:hypothetical protein
MAVDVLEGGLTFPHWPRDAAGNPAISFVAETDGQSVVDVNGVQHGLVPVGLRWQDGVLIDVTPGQLRGPNGELVLPPVLPPG